MIQIEFTIYNERTRTGYETITHVEPSLELALDFMHKYHNRSTSWYRWIDLDINKRYARYDAIGVL